MLAEKEQYALIRACARSAEFLGQKILLIDDDGNGTFNDQERDALLIGDQPVTRLGKHVLIKDRLVRNHRPHRRNDA